MKSYWVFAFDIDSILSTLLIIILLIKNCLYFVWFCLFLFLFCCILFCNFVLTQNLISNQTNRTQPLHHGLRRPLRWTSQHPVVAQWPSSANLKLHQHPSSSGPKEARPLRTVAATPSWTTVIWWSVVLVMQMEETTPVRLPIAWELIQALVAWSSRVRI